MDRKLLSGQDHELQHLARKYGTTIDKVREIIKQTGSRSRKQIEDALDRQYRHQAKKEHE